MRFAARNFLSTDRVDHGSGTSLDNVAQGTILAWVRPNATAVAGNRSIYTKNDAANAVIWYRIQSSDPGPNVDLEIFIGRATTSLTARSPADTVIADAWQFLGARWDRNGANGDQDLFIGSLTKLAAEPTTYAQQQVGSGAFDDDSAGNGIVGNRLAGPNNRPFEGAIAWVGLWNRRLSLQEIHAQQKRPYWTPGCVLFTDYSKGGIQADQSPYGNHGTVTGTTTVLAPQRLNVVWRRRRDIAFIPAAFVAPPSPLNVNFAVTRAALY